MSILTFLIGWLFHEDLLKEQEEEMRIRQEGSYQLTNWRMGVKCYAVFKTLANFSV